MPKATIPAGYEEDALGYWVRKGRALGDVLEPQAVAMYESDTPPWNTLAGLSSAISLKRIADALTLPGPEKGVANLADVLSGIEQNTRPGK